MTRGKSIGVRLYEKELEEVKKIMDIRCWKLSTTLQNLISHMIKKGYHKELKKL